MVILLHVGIKDNASTDRRIIHTENDLARYRFLLQQGHFGAMLWRKMAAVGDNGERADAEF